MFSSVLIRMCGVRALRTALCTQDSPVHSGQPCALRTALCTRDSPMHSGQPCALGTALCTQDSPVHSGQPCALGTALCTQVLCSLLLRNVHSLCEQHQWEVRLTECMGNGKTGSGVCSLCTKPLALTVGVSHLSQHPGGAQLPFSHFSD